MLGAFVVLFWSAQFVWCHSCSQWCHWVLLLLLEGTRGFSQGLTAECVSVEKGVLGPWGQSNFLGRMLAVVGSSCRCPLATPVALAWRGESHAHRVKEASWSRPLVNGGDFLASAAGCPNICWQESRVPGLMGKESTCPATYCQQASPLIPSVGGAWATVLVLNTIISCL